MKTIMLLTTYLLFFPILFSFNKAFALTDYQIKVICKEERKKSICIKKLKIKKLNLKNGKKIEIPVIPYKR